MKRIKEYFERMAHEFATMPRLVKIVFAIAIAVLFWSIFKIFKINETISTLKAENEAIERRLAE